jgi:predicted dehydrogenase
VELAGELARDRARVVAVGVVGLRLPNKPYYEKEITFLKSRSYGPGRYDPEYEEGGQDYPVGYVRWTEGRNLEAFADLMAKGRVDVRSLVTHRFSIDDAVDAYELISGKRGEPFLGVLLKYPSETEPQSPATQKIELHPTQAKLPAEVRLGVLGAGNFANTVLLPAMKKVRGRRTPGRQAPVMEFVGIASASGTSARSAAQRFGFQYATSDERQIITDSKVNTVAILTRHHLHAQLIVDALQAGKHVFCEKPLALDDAQLDSVEDAILVASQNGAPGGILMVGFNRRFAPMSQRLKSFLDGRTEPLVAIYRVNGGYIPMTHWLQDTKQGGGRIIGEGCHFIDFLTFLVGAPPIAVSVGGLPDGGRYLEDNVVMNFSFSDGSLGIVAYLANGDKAFPKERVEVFCGGRVAALDDFRSLELISDGRRQTTASRLRQDKGHLLEWQAFVDAIQSGGPPPIPYHHIFKVTRASFRAVEALRQGISKPIE